MRKNQLRKPQNDLYGKGKGIMEVKGREKFKEAGGTCPMENSQSREDLSDRHFIKGGSQKGASGLN